MNIAHLRNGWIAFLLILLILPLTGRTDQVWNEDSQSYVNSSQFRPTIKPSEPQATDEVDLLWDDIHDTDFDDLYGNYSTCYNLMRSLGYNVTQVSEGTLNAALLDNYGVLVLIDTELDYTAEEVTDIQAWIDAGGKLLMVGENTNAFNWLSNNEIIEPYDMQFVSPIIGTTGATNFAPHVITSGLNTLSWPSGSMQIYNTPAQQLAWDDMSNVSITINEAGVTVLVVNDSNMLENGYIYNDDNYQCATNIFEFLAAAGPPAVTVDLTYVSGSPIPASGGNLVYDLFVINSDPNPVDFDGWLEASYEGGTPTTLILREFTDYQSGWTIDRPGTIYPVPAAWAAGNYEFSGKVGGYPAMIWDESNFPFVKSGVSDGSDFVPYSVADAPNPFEVIDNEPLKASSFDFLTAYPNPFNPTTVISFDLPVASEVRLSVYDVTGRDVGAGYKPAQMQAGHHSFTFDGTNLPSGIYFCRLTAGDFTATGKMVLMK